MAKRLLHSEIYGDLLMRIQSGQWKPGELLPTETELQQMYGVSRAPIRQAMDRLQHEGFVLRQAGRGTYVCVPADRAHVAWRHLTGFADHYMRDVGHVTAKLLSMDEAVPPPEGVEVLRLAPGQQVLRVRRLRLVREEKVAYLEHFISPELGHQQGRIADQPSFRSMTVFLEQVGYFITEVRERIAAVAAPPDVADVLGVPQGHPLLLIVRSSFDAGQRPLEFVRYYVDSDRWQYSAVFRR